MTGFGGHVARVQSRMLIYQLASCGDVISICVDNDRNCGFNVIFLARVYTIDASIHCDLNVASVAKGKLN